MPKEYSPFTPGVPVPKEFFTGRVNEIQQFVATVKKSIGRKSLERIFVQGERGIGKSSLCSFCAFMVENDYKVLPIHVFLGEVGALEEMAKRVFEGLIDASVKKSWFDSIKNIFEKHLQEVDLFGVQMTFNATKSDLSNAVNNFSKILNNLWDKIRDQRDGVLLILDDLNGLAANEKFANWLKSLIDGIAVQRDSIPLTLVLVGLPERRSQLIASQPSLDRVFDPIEIRRFNEEETNEFFRKAFEKVGVKVSSASLKLLNVFSNGYPVFMHELGDAVYQINQDNLIDEEDVTQGIRRATRIIGEKYIEPKIVSAIKSIKYKRILKRIAEGEILFQFTRKDIQEKLTKEEANVFDNFLRKMRKLDVIQQDAEFGRGAYVFTKALYWLFLRLQA
ncbi:MAG: NACHT domain-containing protein [Candidatus Omnitrophota bacterium]